MWGALVKINSLGSHWWYFEFFWENFCLFLYEWFNTDPIYESISQIWSRADAYLIVVNYPSLQQSLKTAGFSGTEPSDTGFSGKLVKMFSIFPASVTSAASETDFLLAVQREMRRITACHCQRCQTHQKWFTKCMTRLRIKSLAILCTVHCKSIHTLIWDRWNLSQEHLYYL